jgi:hypothetical protein
MRTAIISVAAVLTLSSMARAETYVIDPHGWGDYPTIQAAIDAAVAGDVIELTDGLFLGAGNRDIDYQGKAITVRSASDDPESCVIDCQGSFADPHRGFYFHSGEGSDSIVRGITITHGSTLDTCPGCHGGGIYCTESS